MDFVPEVEIGEEQRDRESPGGKDKELGPDWPFLEQRIGVIGCHEKGQNWAWGNISSQNLSPNIRIGLQYADGA